MKKEIKIEDLKNMIRKANDEVKGLSNNLDIMDRLHYISGSSKFKEYLLQELKIYLEE